MVMMMRRYEECPEGTAHLSFHGKDSMYTARIQACLALKFYLERSPLLRPAIRYETVRDGEKDGETSTMLNHIKQRRIEGRRTCSPSALQANTT